MKGGTWKGLFLMAFLGGVLGGVSTTLYMGTPLYADSPQEIVSAKQFVLVGQNGKIRGVWSTSADGTASLAMTQADGETLAGEFSVQKSGMGNFALFNYQGKLDWMARWTRRDK